VGHLSNIETITIMGEGSPRPWYNLWWFGNDEASAEGNTFVYKYIRNPMQNFRWYVVGVVDRDHTVTGEIPVMYNLWTEAPPPYTRTGWKISWVNGWLPYVSYAKGKPEGIDSDGFVFYLGWQPSGGLGYRLTGLRYLFK
jgi:hypothetical protein